MNGSIIYHKKESSFVLKVVLSAILNKKLLYEVKQLFCDFRLETVMEEQAITKTIVYKINNYMK